MNLIVKKFRIPGNPFFTQWGKGTKWLLSIAAVAAFTGCATPIPFNTVTLGGEPTVTSSKQATLTHVSGAVRGSSGSTLIPVGTIFVPVSTGPVPHLQFHSQDQSEFVDVLRSELLRLKVFQTINLGESQATSDFKITILFAQTYHQIHYQEYTLDVAMNIEGGSTPFLKKYRVNSNEKSTMWERWTTNAYEGKALAVRRLLEQLMPDIQAYVAQNG